MEVSSLLVIKCLENEWMGRHENREKQEKVISVPNSTMREIYQINEVNVVGMDERRNLEE